MTKVILASTSPRRCELLSAMNVDFEVVASEFDEYLDHNRPASDIASELAYGKAMAVAKQHPDCIVIGADTIPHLDGLQLEKPIDYDDAVRMLTLLSGHEHQLTIGLAVIWLHEGFEFTTSDTTIVSFKPYDQQAIVEYLALGTYKDMAGAYGIQNGAAVLIASISGEYDTIIGLPTKLLSAVLRDLGVDATVVDLEPPVPKLNNKKPPRR